MKKTLLILFAIFFVTINFAQKTNQKDNLLKGIHFRNIGPALMSGRISDIAIDPEHHQIWYVAAASAGVWKTENAGTTWQPIFDQQKVFSTGCITIDPNNSHRIWVGTGENVGGRHMSFGDGVYVSNDDGKTWQNMGLKKSEHISEIIVHPKNSDIIWVAAQGPLWSKSGQRGLYKSINGGKTWKKTLGDGQWTGVTDIAIDPRNPDRLYAATWERHRTVAAYMGGGYNTTIYRSEDGGETWKKIDKGLPQGKKGKIGIAISPVNPDVIYAAIELNRRKGAVYKSTDRGASWTKQSDAVAGGTGPHYYQELYASPHNFDEIYLANVRMLVSEDGGKHFHQMFEKHKHSDNHVLKFLKDDPNYLLVGTDGGIYESFDKGRNWRFINNLPITQFYKMAVDDTKPFYYIYGGTQDNSTQKGPSRTTNANGIANRDWEVVLFADGYQPAIEPGNPNIIYAEWQEGNLIRKDMTTNEAVHIQPQPDVNEGFERFNWDAPILISPYVPTTIYYASQRVWKSENRGDDWTPISGDLTQYEERFNKPIMGKRQSWDSPWDVYAMSTFNTITSLAASPVQKGVLYAGTDDGLIQVTKNEGKTWTKIKVNKLPGVPPHAFVNDIKADLFDAGTVYVCLDNHKEGDYRPYIYKSTDFGKTWKSISGNLSSPLMVWRLVQDYKKPDLLFVGTEFGLYYSLNGGKHWQKFPIKANISFRDLAIKKGDDDLIGASFGRGFFILDDYSFLRNLSSENLNKKAVVFKPRDSWWFFPNNIFGSGIKGSQGASYFQAQNPPYGTTFTYYLKDGFKSLKSKRQKKEKQLEKNKQDISFPGWEALDKEINEIKPQIFLNILDQNNEIINRLTLKNEKGIYRVTWNHTSFSKGPILFSEKQYQHVENFGVRVAPGTYKAFISKVTQEGDIFRLSDTISFNVKRLFTGSIKRKNITDVRLFWQQFDDLQAKVALLDKDLKTTQNKWKALYKALQDANTNDVILTRKMRNIYNEIQHINQSLYGSKAKQEVGEKDSMHLYDRLSTLQSVWYSSYGPTGTQLKTYRIVEGLYKKLSAKLNKTKKDLDKLKPDFDRLKIPYVEDVITPR